MKKSIFVTLLLLASNLLFAQLLTEDFSYTAGQLITANGWSAHSGAGTNAITVSNGGLTYTGHPGSGVGNSVTMTTSGEDDNRAFTSTNSGSVYMSFLVNVTSVQTGDYFIGLYQSTSIFPVRVYVKTDGSGGFYFGVSKSGGTVSYESTSRTLSTTYLVVVKYTFNTGSTTDDVVDLWVNPTLGSTEPTATIAGVNATNDITSISAAYLRQGGASSASAQQVDAIIVGTTWAQVTQASSVTPSLSATSVSAFSSVIVGQQSTSQTTSLTGANLTGAPGTITATSSSTDFLVSSDNTNWGATATISYTSATLSSTSVYVKFAPQATGTRSGSIAFAGGGASASLSVSGTGTALSAPVATDGTAITGTGFTANWNAVTGATGYFLDVYTQSTGSVTSTIAGWNFATNNVASQTADVGNSNNIAIQTVSLQGLTGNTVSWPSGPSGSTGTPNPYSVSTNGWDNGADTKYWQVDVNTTGVSGITVSSLQGSSNTGPKDFKLQYKVGSAGTWTDVTGGTVTLTTAVAAGNLTTWGALADVALPADAANKPLVSIRWILTSNNAINGSPVASGGTSRISAIYIKGSVSGTVNNYILQNQSVGNVTSYAVSSLTAATTYYYVVRAANALATSDNSNEITVATSSSTPTLSASTLSAFGNICINTTAGPNSFTITGSNLTAGNISMAALSGFTYATTANGTYATTLSIPTTGGSFSQEVFVKFTPTAVQSYSGAILISGGGVSAAVQVSAAGAGVNTLATVTTGSSSNISQTGATLAGSITANGCASVSAYGIEYSTTNGFANGAGTQVASSNISGGSFTAALSSLTSGTTYYYKAYATTAAGTAYGAQQSFTTTSPDPVITATTLTAFGNVCINTTSSANSFTITGTNLTTANIQVAALAGYTYSLTSGGTYTATLSISQSGGSFSQQVYVKFTPTAVQSYGGNIAITGGGVSTAVNVVAAGAGVNTTATVATGSSSSVTGTTATLAGSISSIGCSAIAAYGIEYSTTNGFANGAGTRVAASNLASGSFSSSLNGLTAATTYYYKVYATNSGGTTYGAQQSFTTAAPPPPSLSLSALAAYSNTCVGSFAGPNTFTITGANLTTALITVGPLNGFTFSQTPNGSYSDVIGILQTGGSQSITVYVRFVPTAAQTYSGNIPVYGGGATTTGVAASGTGVNTPASIITSNATGITTTQATLSATYSNTGCSAVTGYGIEYSSINGFANGTGTRVVGTGAASGSFSVTVTGLVPGATYYYKGYVTTNGAISYGAQQSFTVGSLSNKFSVFPSPALRGAEIKITKASLTPGNYTAQFFNQNGQLVFQQQFNVQSNYINQTVTLPASMPFGIYRVVLANQEQKFEIVNLLVQ